ncbi:uncharacterized protein LOC106179280 [Lingula anatina]|uniref:Uncharacterized protein LOC106179280 n=1 Tax=Lingula anatina TaxID=7574 RepID=A0A1S3K7P4_LINAN|nr:uncharacterized protein LOC106179280 [Lingula anatina]|eukprot:XP_013418281.1 uncharacterized protein LOC106179280 [Lingula anatina]
MGFRIISTVISVLLFIQYRVATADDFLSGDAVDQNSSHFFTIEEELVDTLPIENVNLRAERDAAVVGTVITVENAKLDIINTIFDSLPEGIIRTQIVTIRNFLDTKALVDPIVYVRSSKTKAIPPKRIGPGEATILEFDQAQKGAEPEGSMVYNIEGTDLYVTIFFHVVPPNTYNARIFRFKAKYSDIYKALHNRMKTVSHLYPLAADDTTQFVIRQECGYKVSVAMTDHERATMQVDVYECPDPIDQTVLVVANETATKAIVDPLTCKPTDLIKCGCCTNVRLSGSRSSANSLFFFPVISTNMFFSIFFAMFYGIPRDFDL